MATENNLYIKCMVELVAAIERDRYEVIADEISGLTEMVTPDGRYTVAEIKGREMRMICKEHSDSDMIGIEVTLVK